MILFKKIFIKSTEPPRSWSFTSIVNATPGTLQQSIKNILMEKKQISDILFFKGKTCNLKESPPSIMVTRNPIIITFNSFTDRITFKGVTFDPTRFLVFLGMYLAPKINHLPWQALGLCGTSHSQTLWKMLKAICYSKNTENKHWW
jgi:hypothetical protein